MSEPKMTAAELRAATRRAISTLTTLTVGTMRRNACWDAVEAVIDAEIAAARPQWQPIETAPKDESAIQGGCWAGRRWLCATVFWHQDYPGWYLAYTGLSRDRISFQPTHWMPLPTAPEEPR